MANLFQKNVPYKHTLAPGLLHPSCYSVLNRLQTFVSILKVYNLYAIVLQQFIANTLFGNSYSNLQQ